MWRATVVPVLLAAGCVSGTDIDETGGAITADGGIEDGDTADASTDAGDGGPLTEPVLCSIDPSGGGFDVEFLIPQALPDGGVAPAACDIYLGHQLSQCIGYDIWSANCHTAANAMTLQSPTNTGTFACQGNPETSPAYHTINWQVGESPNCSDGVGPCTCMYGWGDECCWDDTAIPPNLDTADAVQCATELCLGQYSPGSGRFLPPGQLVEIPGPAVCVRQVSGGTNFSPGLTSACLSCCDDRANYWDGNENGRNYKVEFLSACRSLCNGFFNDGRRPLQDLTSRWGDICRSRRTFWSVSSYYEQCRSCCYDAAIAGNYPQANAGQCVSRCNL